MTWREDNPDACARCMGCGQLANTDDREPWSAWAELPPGSDLAVRMGLVRPEPCHECGGTGKVTEPAAGTELLDAAPTAVLEVETYIEHGVFVWHGSAQMLHKTFRKAEMVDVWRACNGNIKVASVRTREVTFQYGMWSEPTGGES